MEDLVGVSMKLTARNATRIVKRISRMLITRGAAMDPYCRHALGDCLELYADAKGELNDAAKDVFEYRDCFKANVEVSAAMDSASTCEDGFRERRYRSGHPLAVENEVFFRLTAVLLSFINMLHYN
ncbi:unnamed protein product [Linum tenue]|uniref:Pectinesterase inhibitor domain-containing protein n=2 Tax=Linum tenue TaxID=586396 RepID=A0AAV0K9V7_9ROSI|nr:unnamed protein product [Linum tenue]